MKNKNRFTPVTRSLSTFILVSAEILSHSQGQDTALSFDGGDFVSIPDKPAFHQIEAADSVTIEAWIMVNGYPQGWFPIADKYRTATGFGWAFQIYGGPSPNMQFVGGIGPTASVSFTPQLGVWTHVAVAYKRSEGVLRFYVNGTLIGSPAYSADIQTTDSGAFYIGYGPSGGAEYALGRIDEVRLWSRALSSSEIAAYYHTRLSGNESGLVAYWRFDEGAGLLVSDSSASGLIGGLGTAPRTPTWVLPGALASAHQIFWYGDQATCDGTYAPSQGAFLHGNNWLNFIPPGTSDEAAFYSELPNPLQSSGTLGAAPYKIHFGDFNDARPFGSCNSSLIPGGPTSVGSVVVGSGDDWEFYFNSPGGPSNSAPLTVLGNTTIAYDPHPNPNAVYEFGVVEWFTL